MILAVAGSGRKHANSARLLSRALAGVRGAAPGDSRQVFLAELNFRGCIGCRACREGAEGCVLQDDLTEVLADTARAACLLLSAPIYYGYVSGLFKSFLDRWYGFRDGSRTLRMEEGRPALLFLTQGHPDAAAYSWTVQNLEKVLTSYGFRPSTLVGAGLEGETDVLRRPELLARAQGMGAALGG
ncbi:MAG: flavodoxin family protein [Deferrisomatales bacterium]